MVQVPFGLISLTYSVATGSLHDVDKRQRSLGSFVEYILYMSVRALTFGAITDIWMNEVKYSELNYRRMTNRLKHRGPVELLKNTRQQSEEWLELIEQVGKDKKNARNMTLLIKKTFPEIDRNDRTLLYVLWY